MKTIREWCKEIAGTPGHTMATDQKTVCLYQDAIGHSCEEDLTEIANDQNLKETFYRVYGEAYGTVEAIKFYMKHAEQVTRILYEHDEAMEDLREAREQAEKRQEIAEKFQQGYEKAMQESREKDLKIKEQEEEIKTLKAKLYDLITK